MAQRTATDGEKEFVMTKLRSVSPLLNLILLLLAALAEPACAADPAELAAIEQAVGYYLEGGQTGDLEILRRAFHPSARLQFVRDGAYQEWSLEEYLGRKTPGKRSDHRGRVLSIDFAGDSATAKLELDYGSFKFIDYMSLLKLDGRWWIVNKVFYRAGA
jgi:protease I